MSAATANPPTPTNSSSRGLSSSSRTPRRSGNSSFNRPRNGNFSPRGKGERRSSDDHDILFQKFFKSVGPRTYAAQVKRASNGNHYLVLMEGKRDEKTGEIRKTRLFIYSEDFVEFFRLVKSAAEFIKANPVSAEVQAKRVQFWAKEAEKSAAPRGASANATRAGTPNSSARSTPAPAAAVKPASR